jgi:hypothetical protein
VFALRLEEVDVAFLAGCKLLKQPLGDTPPTV